MSSVVTDGWRRRRYDAGEACIAVCEEEDLLAALYRRPSHPGLLGAVGRLVLLVWDAGVDYPGKKLI